MNLTKLFFCLLENKTQNTRFKEKPPNKTTHFCARYQHRQDRPTNYIYNLISVYIQFAVQNPCYGLHRNFTYNNTAQLLSGDTVHEYLSLKKQL